VPDTHDVAAALENAEPVEQDETGLSWAIVDPDEVSLLEPVVPTMLERSDGIMLLYPGAGHTLVGEPESLKSWVALHAAVQTCDAGNTVVWVDFEDSVGTFVQRLETLNALSHFENRRLSYIRPDEGLTTAAWEVFSTGLDSTVPALIVFDGVTEAMTMSGLDPLSNRDAATFNQKLIRPALDNSGAAILSLDHVAKSREQRGRWGAQHKLGVTTVSYSLKVHSAPAPGRDGYAILRVAKDRHGQVRRHTEDGDQIGVVRFLSNPGGLLEIVIQPPGEQPDFRPTVLMERVSKYLETCDQPVSTNNVKTNVTGKSDYIAQALQILIDEGYVLVTRRGQSQLHESIEPYREKTDRNET
jgi:hypothetical protein